MLRGTVRGLSNKETGIKTVEICKVQAIEIVGLRTRSDIIRHEKAQGWPRDLDSENS